MEEIWKDIPDYEGEYQASNLENIRSLDRIITRGDGVIIPLKGKLLKPATHKKGYRLVVLTNKKTAKVHRLVMYAFHGKSELEVDHINGIKADNRLLNLRYVTSRENSHYFRKTKTFNSKYIGVGKNKWGSYYANITINGIKYCLGHFEKEYDAHLCYQEALKQWLDFKIIPSPRVKSSIYSNINFHKVTNKWQSRIRIDGIRYSLGVFPTELEAYNKQQEAYKDWINFNKKPK